MANSEPNEPQDDHDLHLPEGATSFFLSVLAGLGMILFFVGTSETHYDFAVPLGAGKEAIDPTAIPAPTYLQLRASARGVSTGLDADLALLTAPPTGTADKPTTLAARAALRSYDGAPPRIPHAVQQRGLPECLACHDAGTTVRGHTAPRMPHRQLTSCTQCHVVAAAPMPGGDALPSDPRAVDNSFVGMPSPDHGPRAWDIAPPQVPHPAFLHERCDACHGDLGQDALRTPHPWRSSCEQCHAASAEVDQRPGVPR